MNATLPEPLAPLGVIGVLLIAFPLVVWLLQGACYICRLEVPTFTKGSLVILASGIASYGVEQMLGIEPTGNRYYLSFAITAGMAILIQSLMLNLSLFDSFRVQVTSLLLAMTAAVVLVFAVLGGLMVLQPPSPTDATSNTPPTASLSGGNYSQPQSEVVFQSSAPIELSPRRESPWPQAWLPQTSSQATGFQASPPQESPQASQPQPRQLHERVPRPLPISH